MKALIYMYNGLVSKVVDEETGQEIDFTEVEE